MQIEPNTTLIAPAALHLSLYQEILRQKGSCLGVSVLTLEAYLARWLEKQKPNRASLLYTYRQALADLEEDNTFYASREDCDFLSACLEFMMLAALFDLKDFPQADKRDRDLKAIIDRLAPVELWVSQVSHMQFPDADRVRIVPVATTLLAQTFIDRLVEQGARVIDEPEHKRFYYWSASNPRKMMEAVADSIVANKLEAEKVLIALGDPLERYALFQALESRGIPYTYAGKEQGSTVIEKIRAALTYLQDKTIDNLASLLNTFFAMGSLDVRRFLNLFKTLNTSLSQLTYRENTLISADDFQALKELEGQMGGWKQTIDNMQSWTLDSFAQIEAMIRTQIPNPTELDIQAMQMVRDAYTSIRPFLKSPADLSLFIRTLDSMDPGRALRVQNGVLIAAPAQISPLHKHIFYVGADAGSFPGNVQIPGVFGEDYLARLDFPSLESRRTAHLERLKNVLTQPESVTFVCAQSDYQGKRIENSHELNIWLGQLPQFKAVAETGLNLRPSFSMSGLKSQELFAANGQPVSATLNSLNSFEDCALKNLLRYGLRLKSPLKAREYLRQDGRMPGAFMKKSLSDLGKPFYALTPEEVAFLVRDDFSFAREVFPADKSQIDQLEEQTIARLNMLFGRMAPFCTTMDLDICEGQYDIHLQKEVDGIAMDIQGALGTPGRNTASFNVYEKAAQGFSSFDAPAATLNFSIQPKPETHEAFAISYGRGATPAQAMPINSEQAGVKSEQAYLKNAIVAQNFTQGMNEFTDNLARSAKNKTYKAAEERISKQAQDYAGALESNNFDPVHKPSACVHCPYRAICRNAAVEKEGAK